MVALGDANAQRVSLGHDDGDISVREETGWMRITHANYSGTGDTEVIFNETLGSVVYESDRGTIAYQGGGVWKLEQAGQAQMISPPEFHYRGATLTLPAIQVTGDGAASGSVDLTVTPRQQARLVYPNATDATENGTGAPYDETDSDYINPVRSGTVNVTVHSEYADGWESYFRKRTTGNTTRVGENTVTLTLATTEGAPGEFRIPPAGDSVNAGAIHGGHPITDFDVTLDINKTKPHFSFYAEEDGKDFEIHVYSDVNKNDDCVPSDKEAHVSVYYYNGSGGQYESWESDALNPADTDGMEWVCADGDLKLHVDFVSDDITMTYDQIGKDGNFDPKIDDPDNGDSTGTTLGNKWAFNKDMDTYSLRTPTVWDQHDSITYEMGDGKTYYQNDTDNPDTETLNEVTNHYLGLMGTEVDLVAKDGPGESGPVLEGNSQGRLLYEEGAGSKYVTYLHVTKNEIEIRLD
ncbi:hypothetical protein OB916_00850 [Halobacteria archaeon HArc-curdl5-1]|nr:hypothetical protein [Halapricum hydrolyticum]MCU4716616.1 hypothetical protein [Halapricum hydrolyticum]